MGTNQIDKEMTYEDFIAFQQALNKWDYELDNPIREKKGAKSIQAYLESIFVESILRS